MLNRTKVVAAAIAVSIAVGGAGRADAAAPVGGSGWTVAPSPVPDTVLTGVAQPDPGTTWAAGFQITQAGKVSLHSPVLLVRSDANGQGWVPAATASLPDGARTRLNAVTALSSRDGWLVGDDSSAVGGIVTEHWDGASWKLVTAPVPSDTLLDTAGFVGVSGRSSHDAWAVGWAQVPGGGADNPSGILTGLVEHWDGTGWTQAALPQVAGDWALNAVTEVSPGNVWAVGESMDDDQPLLLHFDGHSWNHVATPQYQGVFGEFNAVAASGPDDVWVAGRTMLDDADGGVGHALVEHWDGRSWRQVATPAAAGRAASLTLAPAGVVVVGRTTLAPYPGPGSDGYAMSYTAGTWHSLGLPSGTLFDPSSVVVSAQDRVTAVGPVSDPTVATPQSEMLTGLG